jgi:3'-phosphoadenosine 5'-phosphosulfate (PAPS) 3'-phosphatase
VSLSKNDIAHLQGSAVTAAMIAARYIQGVDRTQLAVEHKVGGQSLASQVVTQVDVECQRLILEHLLPLTKQHQFAVLAEENADENRASEHPRHSADYFWCIDPLDGTLPFIEGSDGYAVSIALVDRSGKACLGVVVNPETMQLYQANHLCIEPELTQQVDDNELHLYIDRSFKSDARFTAFMSGIQHFAQTKQLNGVILHDSCGAVMNAIGVLTHQYSCYVKLPKSEKGGGSLWDFAATAAIFNACSTASVSDCFNQPLDLNRKQSNFMNHSGVMYSNGVEHIELAEYIATVR